MDRLVFRPLRGQSPAVMLVATFAVAFLLQSIALLWFGPLGKIAASLASLNRPVTIGGVDIRKITIVAVVVAARLPRRAVSSCSSGRRSGLHMRAASMDFRDRAAARRAREPRDRRRRAHLGRARRGRRGDADRADAARDAGLRAARHDRRARRRRARRDEPADLRDARRLRDRLRERVPRRRAADRAEPVPAVVPLRGGDPRPARAARTGCSRAARGAAERV